ncbi:MAG: methionine--tRNA ligase [Candidatus Methanomethylicia archaeon]|nr:methionine--tRNA ligase [Candidatus Methanomethylicia archaeon]MDW7988493.1 methionine--tRNA ligase [Nitrososphaerota archaeon]
MGKWVICAAWPYVNAFPHLGTMVACMVSPDVFARYLRAIGEDVVFVSGSDEHGTPIEVEARKLGIPPKELTDKLHNYIVKLCEKFGISYDNYTRTENPIHIDFVQKFFMKLYENGYIYEKDISLPFCSKCNIFLPDRFIEGVCPFCSEPRARGDQCPSCHRILDPIDLLDSHCVFCGSKPEIKVTRHWFFDLPKLSNKLSEFVTNHKLFSDSVKNYCKMWFKEGLKSRSITRDNSWGIPAPFTGASGKTIYVWFEALLGYISATKEYFHNKGREDEWIDYWFNKDSRIIFFIGKDNIPFHAIIFPAMLMASEENYVLPWQISSIEFLMFEGQAFSKSRGIGVWMDEALEIAPADYWRFALILIRPETRDLNFTWESFHRIVNSELNDNLGNFIHRTLSFIYSRFNAKIPKPYEFDDKDRSMLYRIKFTPKNIGSLIENLKLKVAAESLLEFSSTGNQYLNDKAPWKTIKEDYEVASTTMWIAANLVKSIAIMMTPFMPFSAEKLWDYLNLGGSIHRVNWDEASQANLSVGHTIKKPEPLFTKLPEDFIKTINYRLKEIRAKLARPEL